MAALILAAIAVPAAAPKQVPFKGAVQGRDTDNRLREHDGNKRVRMTDIDEGVAEPDTLQKNIG